MNGLLQDLRWTLRQLRRERLATAAILATLGLGIGANSAIFGLADAVLLRPLRSVVEPERLLSVFAADEHRRHRSFVYSDYVDLREQNRTFRGLAAWVGSELAARTADRAEWVSGVLVSDDYFSVLGVRPVAGRAFAAGETERADDAIAVVAEGFARRHFGSADVAVGRPLDVNGHRYTVVGVTPSRFRGLSLDETPEIWLPLTRYDEVASGFFASFQATDYAAQRGDRRIGLWNVVGRLGPGVTRGAAEADLRRVAAALAEAFPRTNADLSFRAVPAATAAAPLAQRGDSKGLLLLLAGTVGVTLLIACANIANLMLARTARRRRELGVRVALGVGPRRLIRQLLVESGTLALLGGGLGLAVAGWTVELLSRFRLPGGIPIAALDVSLDVRLLAFTLLVSLAAALLFGLAPAVRALRDDPVAALRGDHADPTGHSPLRAGLVTAQVALCLVLLSGAGLFWRSVRAGMEADLGFEPSNVATLTIDLGPLRYGEERAARFYADVVERIRALPGVESASITATPFGEDAGIGVGSVFREGEEASREVGRVTLSRITPGYFATAGLPLRAGRDFEESDRAGAPLMAIVSEEMAERVWPGADAVGRRFNFSGPGRAMFTVVGVVSDAKRVDLREETSLFAYLPLAQHADAAAGDPMTLYVRTAGPPLAAVAPAREAVRSLDPQVPVHDVTTLEERLAGVLMPQRMGRAVLTLFGGLALLLAVVGTYGVVAYSVSRRTREIGIRRALGAGRIEVVRAAAREGGRPVAIGLLLGSVATLLVTGGLSRFLYGVEARDPVALGLAASLLAAAGAAACLVPAARAGRIEPAEALRHE